METKKVYQLECTESEIFTLDECLGHAVDSLESFNDQAMFELNAMVQSYIKSEPSRTKEAFSLLYTVNAAFLNLAKHKTQLANISSKAYEVAETI